MAIVGRLGPGGRLFTAFAVLSLVPVLALGIIVASQNRVQARERGEARAASQVQLVAAIVADSMLSGNDLSVGLTDVERQEVAGFAESAVRSGAVVRLRLRDRAGNVVYSTEQGEQPGPEEDALEAAEGRSVTEITRLDADGRASERGPRVIEVYAPLRLTDSGVIVGVIEVYLSYEEIAADIQTALNHLYVTLAAGLLVLYLVLGALSYGTTRRLSLLAARYQHLATHDKLTDLPNRELFEHRLETILQDSGRAGAAVLVVGLDRFREVNDTLGHENGDLLLTRIGDRLAKCVPSNGVVARLGGDEFGLVLPGVRDEAALRGPLRRVRDAIQQEIEVAGLPLMPHGSVGVAFAPRDGDEARMLVRRGDIALFEAKRTPEGVVAFQLSQDHYNGERLALAGELRRALQRNELVLHYQPQVRHDTGEVRTLEALVRWQHPARGLIGPNSFIPVAEQTSLIDDLTGWVLDAALADLKEWRRTRPELVVAVNASARSMEHPRFPQLVTRAIERAGASPDWMLLEITETALMADPERAAELLGRLSLGGVRLSLDDFGQGYTSLSQLTRLPLSELKIDKSFVLQMLASPADAVIVRSVVDLAHNLGLDVVAEGVEDEETLHALWELGCDITQGYWLGRPMPADKVLPWLTSRRIPTPRRAPAAAAADQVTDSRAPGRE